MDGWSTRMHVFVMITRRKQNKKLKNINHFVLIIIIITKTKSCKDIYVIVVTFYLP